jgi:hypothetical protein
MACRDGALAALKASLGAYPTSGNTVSDALDVACAWVHATCVDHILASGGAHLSPQQLGQALRAAARGVTELISFASDERCRGAAAGAGQG